MDRDTIMEKYPHLTAQAMGATGKSDPQEAIEALLAAAHRSYGGGRLQPLKCA